MRRLFAWVAIAMAMFSKPALAAEPMFNAPMLTDDELSEARGGFITPSGIEIDFGVMISTSVDGVRMLETAFQMNGDAISASVKSANGVSVTLGGALADANVVPNGDTVAGVNGASGSGTISINGDGSGSNGALKTENLLSAQAQINDLVARHAIGQNVSSLAINTGNGRNIDTQMVVNLKLDNVQTLALGSSGLRIQDFAAESAFLRGM